MELAKQLASAVGEVTAGVEVLINQNEGLRKRIGGRDDVAVDFGYAAKNKDKDAKHAQKYEEAKQKYEEVNAKLKVRVCHWGIADLLSYRSTSRRRSPTDSPSSVSTTETCVPRARHMDSSAYSSSRPNKRSTRASRRPPIASLRWRSVTVLRVLAPTRALAQVRLGLRHSSLITLQRSRSLPRSQLSPHQPWNAQRPLLPSMRRHRCRTRLPPRTTTALPRPQ